MDSFNEDIRELVWEEMSEYLVDSRVPASGIRLVSLLNHLSEVMQGCHSCFDADAEDRVQTAALRCREHFAKANQILDSLLSEPCGPPLLSLVSLARRYHWDIKPIDDELKTSKNTGIKDKFIINSKKVKRREIYQGEQVAALKPLNLRWGGWIVLKESWDRSPLNNILEEPPTGYEPDQGTVTASQLRQQVMTSMGNMFARAMKKFCLNERSTYQQTMEAFQPILDEYGTQVQLPDYEEMQLQRALYLRSGQKTGMQRNPDNIQSSFQR